MERSFSLPHVHQPNEVKDEVSEDGKYAALHSFPSFVGSRVPRRVMDKERKTIDEGIMRVKVSDH